jgi:hypothetical protein
MLQTAKSESEKSDTGIHNGSNVSAGEKTNASRSGSFLVMLLLPPH